MPALLQPVAKGKPIVLDKPIVLIGRHPDCDVVILNSRKISRKHCAIALVDNHFVVRDLGSMNGLWVNGQRVEQQADLDFGDEVMIGDVAYTLQSDKPGDKAKPKSAGNANSLRHTPLAPSRSPRADDEPAPRNPIVNSKPPSDLSMEFPVPLDEDDVQEADSDGEFDIPAPRATMPESDVVPDQGEDDFIPLKDH